MNKPMIKIAQPFVASAMNETNSNFPTAAEKTTEISTENEHRSSRREEKKRRDNSRSFRSPRQKSDEQVQATGDWKVDLFLTTDGNQAGWQL